jgi:outer membrane protein assembly factor BamB
LNFNANPSYTTWSVDGNYIGNPAYANGIIYAMNQNSLQLEARSELDGSLLWSWSSESRDPSQAIQPMFIGDVLVTRNLAFVSTNRFVYAIDLSAHVAVWSFPKPGRLALSENGILYIATADNYGTADGGLIAINLK